jgi:serine/threonine protein kinase
LVENNGAGFEPAPVGGPLSPSRDFLKGFRMGLDESRPLVQAVGNYDLVEKIAEGGMGMVFKGRHRVSGEFVAVKILSPQMAGNEILLKRFEKEYNTAQKLDHPNIVRALEFGKVNGSPYLVMEYVEGESLGQRIERQGAMPEKEAIRLIAQVAQGLQRAHRERLVHRDVKPDNILVTVDGIAKLADLGLVKETETDLNLTRTGRGLGTPHFMAPEQFKDAKNAGPRCDIYSLGATLYMMVTGQMPFQSQGPLDAYMKKIDNKLTPPRAVVPALSERLDWAIRRSMSADPDQRPANCREFVEDLTGRSLRKPASHAEMQPVQSEVWYLIYSDEEDVSHTVKGSVAGIRRSMKEGLLGDASNIRVCRTKEGEFNPLREFPEFRDLVITPQPMAKSPPVIQRPTPVAANSNMRSGRPLDRPPAGAGRSAATPVGNFDSTAEHRPPHIPLTRFSNPDIGPGSGLGWVQMAVLAGLVLASAVAGFFMFR